MDVFCGMICRKISHLETGLFHDIMDKNMNKKERRRTMIPQDPIMLLSFVNLKLRDFYRSLDALCEDLDADREAILNKLASIDYHYDEEKNQFV